MDEGYVWLILLIVIEKMSVVGRLLVGDYAWNGESKSKFIIDLIIPFHLMFTSLLHNFQEQFKDLKD